MYTLWSPSSPTFSLIDNLFLKQVWTVQIKKIWFADIFRLFSCLAYIGKSDAFFLHKHETEHHQNVLAEWKIKVYNYYTKPLRRQIEEGVLINKSEMTRGGNIAFARGGAHLPIAHALRLLSTKELRFGRKNNVLK